MALAMVLAYSLGVTAATLKFENTYHDKDMFLAIITGIHGSEILTGNIQ